LFKFQGSLELDGLTSLSDVQAEALTKHVGTRKLGAPLNALGHSLSLAGLAHLSDAQAAALAKFEGTLVLDGLTSLSDSAAESLAKHKDWLILSGLTSLSDAAAKALAKHDGEVSVDHDKLPPSASKILKDAGHK
jgi:hypothetical protein